MFRSKKTFELAPRLRLGVGRGYSQNQLLKYSAVLCLLIAVGLSLNAVRLVFFSNFSAVTSAKAEPQVLGASDTKTQDPEPVAQFIEYKVKKGDTLFNISQAYNINWTTLATLNNLKSPFTLKQGQVLKIPKP